MPIILLTSFTVSLLLLLFLEVSVLLKIEVYLLADPTGKVESGIVARIHGTRSLYVFWRRRPPEVIKTVVGSTFILRHLMNKDEPKFKPFIRVHVNGIVLVA